MEKGDKAGKPHTHLEIIAAAAIWKCLAMIPSHIAESIASWETNLHHFAEICLQSGFQNRKRNLVILLLISLLLGSLNSKAIIISSQG